MRPLILLAAALLAVPPALAAEESYRYIVSTGTPTTHGFVHCGLRLSAGGGTFPLPGATITVNGQPITVGGGNVSAGGELKPSHGGACFIDVTAGETLSVRVVDDVPAIAFFYQVFFSRPANASAVEDHDFCDQRERASGLHTFTTPAPCVHMHVVPDAGSVAGTVYVTR